MQVGSIKGAQIFTGENDARSTAYIRVKMYAELECNVLNRNGLKGPFCRPQHLDLHVFNQKQMATSAKKGTPAGD